ncbi:MAG: hypothetical protein ABL903_08550 [Methylococcales bacterium]
MSEETVDLTLQRLIRMEKRLDANDGTLTEIKHRLADLEAGQAGIKTDIGHTLSILSRMQVTLDRIDTRLDRIERRLELNETH